MTPSPTRGSGALEKYLARRRGEMADALIPNALRSGAIADLACGVPPLFLQNIQFATKYGLDFRMPLGGGCSPAVPGVSCLYHDLRTSNPLPFLEKTISVVTMLAIIEHLTTEAVSNILNEAYRVLKPGGMLILTTPAAWTQPLLWLLAHLRIVSSEEIHDHKKMYTIHETVKLCCSAGFQKKRAETGSFEGGLNTWLRVEKAG